MQYEIEVGGKQRQVVVTREGGAFAVAVDGTTKQVDVVPIDGQSLSLIVDGVWPVDVTISPNGTAGQMTVHVDGTPVGATVNGRRRSGRRDDADAAGGGSAAPQRLAAPMPGK